MGYPQGELDLHPAELKREYRKAIDRLLASVTSVAPREAEVRFDAVYAGTAEAESALRRDVPLDPTALATAEEMWRDPPASLRCEPPPPSSIQVVYRPNASLTDEAIAQARAWMSGRRLRIVGGQPEQRLLQRIADQFGMEVRDIDWLPCERHKKPPLAKSWGGLDVGRDVAICITGRVGHATSDTASRCARSAGVPFLEVDTATEIPVRLLDLAKSAHAQD
jgi:hypothetical protein